MNIITAKKIKPVAQRMAKGIKPTAEEIQHLRDVLPEVQDTKFRALLNTAGNEPALRELRQSGKDLLSAIRFATGARRKNDLPGFPRPEKIKRMLKRGKAP